MQSLPEITSRYQVLEYLGGGAMGDVYKARDRLNADTVALKRVKLDAVNVDLQTGMGTDTDMHIALANEFRTLAGLRHPNIISVLDYGFDAQGQPFYTMQFVESSQHVLEIAPILDTQAKCNILIELLQGLAYLHRRRVIHRDLKPDNIAVIKNTVKVLDFGLALTRTEGDADMTNEAAGTIPYMAPELFMGHVADVPSDLFAVGVIGYQMFVGRHPLASANKFPTIHDMMFGSADFSDVELIVELITILERLLQNEPVLRYSDAVDVIRDLYDVLDQRMPAETVEIREAYLQSARFVGREAEITLLEGAMREAKEGNASSWLIGGVSGVGKSRLVDELRTIALVSGMTILNGQAIAESGLPFQLWRNVARRLVLVVEPDDFSASVLKDIVPDIGNLLEKEVADPPRLEGSAYTNRLILTLMNLFKKIKSPVFLILQDLHWSDDEDLEPLRQLNQVIVKFELPVMIVANFRSEERPDLHTEIDSMQLMTLGKLDEKGIERLSVSMLGESGREPHLLEILTRETEGNAFFMVEVVRALADAAGSLTDVPFSDLPEQIVAGGIVAVLRRRLAKLPDDLLDWLKPVAVAGRQLDLKIVDYLSKNYGRAHGQLDRNMATGMLRPLIPMVRDDLLLQFTNAAVLEVVDEQYRFSHEKLREVLLQDLPDEQRIAYHRQVAEAIEAVYPGDAAYNSSLYEHWQQAQVLDKEIYYLEPVARHAIHYSSAFTRAVTILQQGLDQLPEADPRRVALWNLQAEAYWLLRNGEQAQKAAENARDLARTLDNQSGLATSFNYLGHAVHIQGDMEKAIDYHQQSLEIRQTLKDDLGIAKSLNNLGDLANRRKDKESSKDYFLKSNAILQTLDDKRLLAMSYNNLGIAAANEKNQTQARDYYVKSLELLQAVGDPFSTAAIQGNLGIIVDELGDYQQAQKYLTESLALCRDIGDDIGEAISLVNLYFVELQLQSFQALMTLEDALRLVKKLNDNELLLEIIVGFAWHKLQQFETTRVLELLGFVKHHPDLNYDVQRRLDKIISKLQNLVTMEMIEAEMERGKTLNQAEIVQEMETVLRDVWSL